MKRKILAALLAAALLMPGAGSAKTSPRIKAIDPTWLCPGWEAEVREEPEEDSQVLWTLDPEKMVYTERHVDQYYLLEDEAGRTGYVSKGAVRICNPRDLTAGILFKLPHVAPKVYRKPVEMILRPGIVREEGGKIFLPASDEEERLPAGDPVYVFAAYGAYAGLWHRGRMGYTLRKEIALAGEEGMEGFGSVSLEDIQAGMDTRAGSVQASSLVTEALSMLEEGNPIALRYEKITGQKVEPLFPQGVPYFWGGKDEKILMERWPDYTTRKQWQGTHDFYKKDEIYVYGLDCVGFVTVACKRAGMALGDSLNNLGNRKHCKAGDHLFCSSANPFPEDWQEVARSLRPGDLLALHYPGRHALIYIGTLREYGYTEEQVPALADYLDYPLMIHSGENPQAFQRFDLLTARSEEERISQAKGSDGGVSLCLLGAQEEDAEMEISCHGKNYACFDLEGACLRAFPFTNIKDYYVYRPGEKE